VAASRSLREAFRNPKGADRSLMVVPGHSLMEAFRSPKGADRSLTVVPSHIKAVRSPEEVVLVATVPTAAVAVVQYLLAFLAVE
jgi:hypothetical protein